MVRHTGFIVFGKFIMVKNISVKSVALHVNVNHVANLHKISEICADFQTKLQFFLYDICFFNAPKLAKYQASVARPRFLRVLGEQPYVCGRQCVAPFCRRLCNARHCKNDTDCTRKRVLLCCKCTAIAWQKSLFGNAKGLHLHAWAARSCGNAQKRGGKVPFQAHANSKTRFPFVTLFYCTCRIFVRTECFDFLIQTSVCKK